MKVDVGVLVDDKFEVLEPKGRGANGATFVAKQIGLDRPILLKTIVCADAIARQRFLREAYALSSITHPNVVAFYGYGTWKQEPYLAMELVPGASFEEVLAANPALPVGALLSIIRQIAAGLECLHKNAIVHRDLTPRNVMVAGAEQPEPKVKIIDLGLAKLLDEHNHRSAMQLTEVGQAIGSVLYMSPEQCRGTEATVASDVYALGCIMYRALAGKPPFDGDAAVTVMLQHTDCEVPHLAQSAQPKLASVIQRLDALIQGCVEKDPAKRFTIETVLSEVDALVDLVQRQRVSGVTPSLVSQQKGKIKGRKWLAATLALAALVFVAVAGGSLLKAYRHAELAKRTGALQVSMAYDMRKGDAAAQRILKNLEQLAHDAEVAGEWDFVRAPVMLAADAHPNTPWMDSPALAELAQRYYVHLLPAKDILQQRIRFNIARNLLVNAALRHDKTRMRHWFDTALADPASREPQNAPILADFIRLAAHFQTDEQRADLCSLYFQSLRRFFLLKLGGYPAGYPIMNMREPVDAMNACAYQLPKRRDGLLVDASACLDAAATYSKTPPDKEVIAQFRGDVAMTAHKYDDAIRYFKDALALERVTGDRGADSVRVRFSLAQGLEAIGKRDEATAVAREAVELSKSTDDPRAYLVATRIYASLLADRDATTRGALDAARVAWNAADDYRRKILASNAVDIDKNNANSFAKVAEEVLLRVEKAQNLPHLSK